MSVGVPNHSPVVPAHGIALWSCGHCTAPRWGDNASRGIAQHHGMVSQCLSTWHSLR